MEIGETKTINVTDSKGVITQSITITRTHRPYNYDLADAYNANRMQHVIDNGGIWVPTPGGGVALVQRPEWTETYTKELKQRREEERERWKYMREHPFEQEEMFDEE